MPEFLIFPWSRVEEWGPWRGREELGSLGQGRETPGGRGTQGALKVGAGNYHLEVVGVDSSWEFING